jgi:hypothetical protein
MIIVLGLKVRQNNNFRLKMTDDRWQGAGTRGEEEGGKEHGAGSREKIFTLNLY